MGIVTVTPPAVFPVSLVEAKKTCELPDAMTAHDDHLTRLIAVATEVSEAYTKRAWINQTLKLTLPRWPCYRGTAIGLPYPPLSSITTVEYVDTDGVLQTLAGTEYQSTTSNQPGWLAPAYGKSWPSIRCEVFDPIRITYVAGYGAAASAVPADAKEAMLLLVNTWFNNREEVVIGLSPSRVPINALWLLDGLKAGTWPGWYDPGFEDAFTDRSVLIGSY